MKTSLRFWAVSAASAAFLALAPAGFAAQSGNSSDTSGSGSSQAGTTSGPAVGSTVVPNTAATKHMTTGQSGSSGQSGSEVTTAGAAGAGAAGTPAAQGSESGQAPAKK